MGEGIWTLLRDHAIQVDLDDLALEDAEVALGPYVLTNADDADRGVVDRELLVLLERLAQRVQTVPDEVLERAWSGAGEGERGREPSAARPKRHKALRGGRDAQSAKLS